VNDPGAVNKFQGIQHLVGQFQDAVDGKNSAKELEEMVVAVALTKLKSDPMPAVSVILVVLDGAFQCCV